ncbi:tetratricopeptide repeat protein [Flavobacterium sp.]|uniref:tetratricopeptide repeat protein n=1 Tax=Flavobacterium sp. TaxID=239 RepID=UPI0026394B29|nr:tetratricopeptide repeat protein [Flavobacterium sp.]
MKSKLFIFIFFITLFANAQNKEIDSLKNVLNQSKNDIDKANVYNLISDNYKTSNPKLMLDYANKALQLSKKINHKEAEGTSYLNIGNANIILGNYSKALENFSQAQNIFENQNKTIEVRKGLAKAYGSIGIIFSEQSNYANALKFYLKSVKIYEDLKDDAKSAKLYNNIGIVYKSQGEDFKALEYFVKAQKIQEKLNDTNIGITLTNIANCYLNQKSFDKAFDYYSQAKSSLDNYPNQRALGEWYNNFGLFFKATNKTSKAIENWNQAIKTFQSIDDKFGIADTYIYLSQLYFDKGNYQEALQFANKSLNLSKEINVLEQIVLSEKLLSDIYSKIGNANLALEHYKLYSKANDSLINETNIRKSVQEEMTYEFEKREVIQKEELEKRELLLQEQSKRNKMQLFFAVLSALLLSGIGFLIYNRTQLKKTLTLQKELAEYEQKALHLQMNPHFVFNCLGSISSFIVQNGTDTAVKYLAKFSKLMRLTLEYSKESLIPIDKEIESLQNYLELEQLRFNQKFDFTISKSSDIEDDTALPPLLLQPFVENAIIHGLIPKKEKGLISIKFSLENESLICTIEDNGIGFNKSKEIKESLVSVHKSMALDITKKRLEMMEVSTSQKAHVEIEENKNNQGEILGTKVVLNLPLQYIK